MGVNGEGKEDDWTSSKQTVRGCIGEPAPVCSFCTTELDQMILSELMRLQFNCVVVLQRPLRSLEYFSTEEDRSPTLIFRSSVRFTNGGGCSIPTI